MDSDDEQVGRLLTRREALAVMGVSGAALLSGGAAAVGTVGEAPALAGFASGTIPACVVRPEQTEGPFFVDRVLNRADVRADPVSGKMSEGAPLELTFTVSRIGNGGCVPLTGAQVDVWQCDALGVYSGVNDRQSNAEGQKFLRGYQITDGAGRVAFTTIYPGWYQGRAVHIHFKIRTNPGAPRGEEFISQLYFDDALTDKVHAGQPYATKGQRDRRNASDGIFRRGGSQLTLTVTDGAAGGYAASFDIGLQV